MITPERLRVLVVTKGHPFVREAFFAVFDADTGIDWAHADQPAARAVFHPERAADFDVIVLYDMPGIRFTGGDPPTVFPEPPTAYVEGFNALLEAGKGMVFLHHAVAGWPAWPGYADIVGGRFHYQPASLRGVDYPDSGYVFDVEHTVEVVAPDHPVCSGLGDSFSIVDELYCFPVFEDDVVPLMRTTFPTADHNRFFSADLAIRGRRNEHGDWSHPAGSNLVAWAKHAGNSPITYLQFGDGPVTYASAPYRTALANAIRWVASPDAHAWARARHAADPA